MNSKHAKFLDVLCLLVLPLFLSIGISYLIFCLTLFFIPIFFETYWLEGFFLSTLIGFVGYSTGFGDTFFKTVASWKDEKDEDNEQ